MQRCCKRGENRGRRTPQPCGGEISGADEASLTASLEEMRWTWPQSLPSPFQAKTRQLCWSRHGVALSQRMATQAYSSRATTFVSLPSHTNVVAASGPHDSEPRDRAEEHDEKTEDDQDGRPVVRIESPPRQIPPRALEPLLLGGPSAEPSLGAPACVAQGSFPLVSLSSSARGASSTAALEGL